jgi:hypothetical protein
MRDVKFYAVKPLLATIDTITIECMKDRLPSPAELLRWQNRAYIVVYIVSNSKGMYNVRCELTKYYK